LSDQVGDLPRMVKPFGPGPVRAALDEDRTSAAAQSRNRTDGQRPQLEHVAVVTAIGRDIVGRHTLA